MKSEQTTLTRGLLFFAVKEEAAPLDKWLQSHGWKAVISPQGRGEVEYTREGRVLRRILTGMGREKAAEVSEKALSDFTPDFVLTCGFAGALNPALKIGSAVWDTNPPAKENPVLLASFPTVKRSRPVFLCAEKTIRSSEEKSYLFQQTGYQAVEMESGIIMELCAARRIPCVTFRTISDSARQDLPLDFDRLMKDNGKISVQRLAGEILLHPFKIPALIRLGMDSGRAAQSLAYHLSKLLTQLFFNK